MTRCKPPCLKCKTVGSVKTLGGGSRGFYRYKCETCSIIFQCKPPDDISRIRKYMIDHGYKKINHKKIDKNAVVDKERRVHTTLSISNNESVLESVAVQSLVELNNTVSNDELTRSVELVRKLANVDPRRLDEELEYLRDILVHFNKTIARQISACHRTTLSDRCHAGRR